MEPTIDIPIHNYDKKKNKFDNYETKKLKY